MFNSKLEARGGNPTLKKKFLARLIEFKETCDLCDIWRVRNTKSKRFTYYTSLFQKKTTIRGTGPWKFNSSLTKDQNYKTEMKKLIRNFSNENESLLNCQLK